MKKPIQRLTTLAVLTMAAAAALMPQNLSASTYWMDPILGMNKPDPPIFMAFAMAVGLILLRHHRTPQH